MWYLQPQKGFKYTVLDYKLHYHNFQPRKTPIVQYSRDGNAENDVLLLRSSMVEISSLVRERSVS